MKHPRPGVWRFLVCVLLGGLSLARAAEPPSLPDGLYAEIVTPRGTIVVELLHRAAPLTVTNFVGLAEGTLGGKKGKPFFNGLTFHRIVPDFVVQGGDPLGTGEGGPGYNFPDEFAPGLTHAAVGVLSMANAGPDTNGSQFFITLAPLPRLDYLHSVFGRTLQGIEVLPKLLAGDTMEVRIRREGEAAQTFRADEEAFAALVATTRKFTAAGEPGPAAFMDDPANLLPVDPPRARGFNFKLANFERATGKKIFVRLLAQAPPDTEGRKLSGFTRELASKLGLERDGVLLLYVADRNEWRLWIGDTFLTQVMRRPGTVDDFMRDGALHARKEELLAGAKRIFSESADVTPQQRLKLACDAALESIFDALVR